MQIILASANAKKIKELKAILGYEKIVSYEEILGKFEIVENGKSFLQNAWIKARAIEERVGERVGDYLVVADDSGLCVEALGGMPSIYSARFSSISASLEELREGRFEVPSEGGSDEANNLKLLEYLRESGVSESGAKFVCAIAVCGRVRGERIERECSGELEGKVIFSSLNPQAFGYDPLFVPNGYEITLDKIEEKNTLSHRYHALQKLKDSLKGIL
ncbi:non-canonical purine NTP pyrophosphatase [Helicobacter brantae]|uniref:Non-canonical purine NTP pyrophosphatase n=1 Tax=Helicobacter brantae TaxID=375927 RepID=A0A3D8J077_9HELI|nr:non-canonical purine NTP pyrophosphatase [Helicobacter brantae]RDU70753.1 non-canonical purine NTP pyrophosphatase [Helicobacter brantae]